MYRSGYAVATLVCTGILHIGTLLNDRLIAYQKWEIASIYGSFFVFIIQYHSTHLNDRFLAYYWVGFFYVFTGHWSLVTNHFLHLYLGDLVFGYLIIVGIYTTLLSGGMVY